MGEAMEMTSKPLSRVSWLANVSSSGDRFMMFLPQSTRSSAPVMPIADIASRAGARSEVNSSVIAAIRSFGFMASLSN